MDKSEVKCIRRHSQIINGSLPLSLKKKEYGSCILRVLTYGAVTSRPTKRVLLKLSSSRHQWDYHHRCLSQDSSRWSCFVMVSLPSWKQKHDGITETSRPLVLLFYRVPKPGTTSLCDSESSDVWPITRRTPGCRRWKMVPPKADRRDGPTRQPDNTSDNFFCWVWKAILQKVRGMPQLIAQWKKTTFDAWTRGFSIQDAPARSQYYKRKDAVNCSSTTQIRRSRIKVDGNDERCLRAVDELSAPGAKLEVELRQDWMRKFNLLLVSTL